MKSLWQDVRYGARMLWKRPGFTVVAVAALALGIGANTAIFSVVNGVLLRPLPLPEPERLVQISAANVSRGTTGGAVAYPDVLDWRERTQSFEALAAYTGGTAALTGDGATPEQIDGVITTPELLRVVGVQPARGRFFTNEEAARISRRGEEGEGQGSAQVVVISHGLWQRRFGGDPSVVGRSVTLDNAPATVVGVMPEGFRFPLDFDRVDFWSPLDADDPYARHRGASYLSAVARLKDGVSVERARADIFAVSEQLAAEHPRYNTNRRAEVTSLHEQLVGDLRPALLVLLGAVGFVLLIACANVANLLLARSAARQKEFAIRTAMGASRWRIMRQLLTESVILSLAGGVLGLLLTLWGIDLLLSVVPADVPRLGGVGADARVLLFTLGVSALTGVVFGLAPAVAASKTDLNETLKEGERGSTGGRQRVRGALVVAEVALSLMLLTGAGLLVRSFYRLTQVDPGFKPEGVLTASVSLSDNKYEGSEEQSRVYGRIVERAQAVPGAEAVGAVFPLPLSGNNIGTNFTIDGRSFEDEQFVYRAEMNVISPDLPRALGMTVVRGRAFTERDTRGAPNVFLVNEALARRYFPGEDAVGRQMSMRDIEGISTGEIVGVVADVRHLSLTAEATPAYYMPYQQKSFGQMSLVARARPGIDPTSLAGSLRAAVQEVDPDQPIADVRTLNALLRGSLGRERFQTLLLGLFAGLALVLAAVGLFGVMSYTVTQRTHEIGIRMALGASGRDILRLIVGRGMWLALVGVGCGLAGALALTRLMSGLLYGVSTYDPLTFAAVTTVLLLVAFLSCYLPARRATKVDPMEALRYE